MAARAAFIYKFFGHQKTSDYIKDIIGGIITALVSIPISMGYAQIAGLPMQYGLYGSVIPIFLFGIITSSKDFVFGVDAAPAALVGTAISSMGISAGSEQAISAVPLTAFFTAFWLLMFYFLKAGKIVQYISEPVMAGFVSGICCTIILMQIPKLFGGSAGNGEAPELIKHIIEQAPEFNLWSFGMGLSVIVIITVFRHITPKIPMSVIMMISGAAVSAIFNINELGVRLLPDVESGFPGLNFHMPDIELDKISELLFTSLSIAAVILSESLLASRGNALKDGYKLNSNRELLAYSAANLASAFSGCCPVNGSVSRTGIVRQFGVKSQLMSVFASLTMLAVIFFGTGFISLLPVPVLTAIVISALMGACEFDVAKHFFRTDKKEFYIFAAAFSGVLIFGTVYGVIIGVTLSFIAVIIRAVTPPKAFMGVIPGRDGFYPLDRSTQALPIKNTVIYRFSGNLFFANIDSLIDDIEQSVKEHTKIIIINAGAVGSIDSAAAQHLLMLYHKLKAKDIRLYITEHIGEINDCLRKYGAGELVENGAVRMTIQLALRDAGVKKPYKTETPDSTSSKTYDISPKGMQAELEWALGSDAEVFKSQLTEEIYLSIKNSGSLTVEAVEKIENLNRWGRFNLVDEDELLDRLEARILNRAIKHPDQAEKIEDVLEKRRIIIEQKITNTAPETLERLRQNRLTAARELYINDPDEYEKRRQKRTEHIAALKKINPDLAERYRKIYKDILEISESIDPDN